MPKPDFPALLQPGIHVHTLASIEAIAVTPFPGDLRRATIFHQFRQWVASLQALHVTGRLWIDGSFLTAKPDPDDVDCVIWYAQTATPPTPIEGLRIKALLERANAKAMFNVDIYMELPPPADLMHREAYWKGLLGFCHDGVTAKGFAEIQI